MTAHTLRGKLGGCCPSKSSSTARSVTIGSFRILTGCDMEHRVVESERGLSSIGVDGSGVGIHVLELSSVVEYAAVEWLRLTSCSEGSGVALK